MKYLMIHCVDESAVDWWDDDQADADSDEETLAVMAWDAEMKARGVLVGGGFLRPTSSATTVKVRAGQVLVSDGPFAETKEQIAGFCVLECTDLDEAIEVASRHPTAVIGTFELRPYAD
ncbi:MAG TPA: YciI family protein [Streptosporangiaceae bacterium]|nr:YciI family protein [Streptosporangiaceae bacterium]